jgi:hypothetical protein
MIMKMLYNGNDTNNGDDDDDDDDDVYLIQDLH